MDVSSTRRIIMMGKTGTGKSSLGNTVFGEKLFKIGHSVNSETRECQAETKSVNGRSITLIDTPGFFDTDRSEEEMKLEIMNCITECAPGPHAFLIVLKVDRFTEQEQAVITKISQYFSEEAFKYTTVVFTHGDQLGEGQTIEDFVCNNQLVSDLMEKCEGRCHVVDNKHWKNQQHEYRNNQFQVEELLNTIDKITEANKGSCYTNEMLQTVEKDIQQEEENIRQSSGDMSEEEIRKQAKDRVLKKLLIKLTGIATGVLLGALFGVGGMVGNIVAVLADGAAGMPFGLIAVTRIAVGAVKGGITGYNAAKGADTPREAAKKAAVAVKKGSVFKTDRAKAKTHSKPLMGPDS